ncbi:MAG: hypothetical protein RI894_114 [Bacteroidota bacterium]
MPFLRVFMVIIIIRFILKIKNVRYYNGSAKIRYYPHLAFKNRLKFLKSHNWNNGKFNGFEYSKMLVV